MRKLVIGTALAAALGLLVTQAWGQQTLPISSAYSDPRIRWNPIKRAVCIGLTDDACDQVTWPNDYNVGLMMVGQSNSEKTSDMVLELRQLSNVPGDTRAIACVNLVSHQNFGQFCNYGANYPNVGYAGYTKIRADGKGLIMGAFGPEGTFRFVAGGDDRAFVGKHGFGIQDIPQSGIGIFALAYGTAPGDVPEHNVYLYEQVINGVSRVVAKHSDGSIVCISCPGEAQP